LKPIDEANWDDPGPVIFSWNKTDKAQEYRIVISKDADQKEIIKTKTGPENTFNWRWAQQGSVYWSVKGLSQKGTVVGQSEIRKLNIKVKDKGPLFEILYPKDQTEVTRDVNQDPEPVLFQWRTLR